MIQVWLSARAWAFDARQWLGIPRKGSGRHVQDHHEFFFQQETHRNSAYPANNSRFEVADFHNEGMRMVESEVATFKNTPDAEKHIAMFSSEHW